MNESIWYDDIQTFLKNENMFDILPLASMTFEEKLNSIVRFSLYMSIFLALVTVNAKYLAIFIVTGLLSYVFYQYDNRDKQNAEKFLKSKNLEIQEDKLCTTTTIDNPFMNPSIADIKYNPQRPEACNIDKVKDRVEANFKKRVFKDVNDIWGREYSSREFYTVPSTTIPNNQGGYAKWLYGTPPTCKEGNGLECKRNTYRHILR